MAQKKAGGIKRELFTFRLKGGGRSSGGGEKKARKGETSTRIGKNPAGKGTYSNLLKRPRRGSQSANSKKVSSGKKVGVSTKK